MALEFNESKHEYSEDGIIIPSVTQILNEVGITDNRWYADGSAERGTRVHKISHYLDDGDLNWNTVDEEAGPYVKAYELFLKEVAPIWRLIEYRFHNKIYGYTGTLDREGLIFGHDAILDIKTGGMPKWTAIQTAAYNGGINDNKHRIRYGLQLKKNGLYKLHEFTNPNDFKIFTSATAVVNYKRSL